MVGYGGFWPSAVGRFDALRPVNNGISGKPEPSQGFKILVKLTTRIWANAPSRARTKKLRPGSTTARYFHFRIQGHCIGCQSPVACVDELRSGVCGMLHDSNRVAMDGKAGFRKDQGKKQFKRPREQGQV